MPYPNPFDSSDQLTAANLNAALNELYTTEYSGVYSANFYPDEAKVLTGNSISLALDGTLDRVYGFHDTPAINDEWKHGAFLNADTYTLTLRAIKTSGSGILKIKVDDVVVATFDLYNASDALATLTQASIVIADGWHTIKGLVESKNGSSSGYDARWIKLYLQGDSA